MDASNRVVRYGLKRAFGYMEKDPEENLPKLMEIGRASCRERVF